MDEREQFTFYASFAKSIKRIRKPADRAAAYDAIVNYALYGLIPDLEKLPDSAAITFEIAKPILDSSRKKAANGKKGGQVKQSESKGIPEANLKQEETESKQEANDKQTESKNKDKNKDKDKIKDKCPLSPKPPSEVILEALAGSTVDLLEAVNDWVRYKQERRETYKETGLRSLLTQIRKAAETYGDPAVIDVIRRSMGANYQGIVFDWLGKQNASKIPKQYTPAAEYHAPNTRVDQGMLDKIRAAGL